MVKVTLPLYRRLNATPRMNILRARSMFTRRAKSGGLLLGALVGRRLDFGANFSFTWDPPAGCRVTLLVGYGISLLCGQGSTKSLTFRQVMTDDTVSVK